MACRRPYLNEDEIFRLLYDTDENKDLNDKSNYQMSSEDEEDAVEEDCEDDVDSIYDIDDMNKLDESSTDNPTTEESTDEDANSYEAKNFT